MKKDPAAGSRKSQKLCKIPSGDQVLDKNISRKFPEAVEILVPKLQIHGLELIETNYKTFKPEYFPRQIQRMQQCMQEQLTKIKEFLPEIQGLEKIQTAIIKKVHIESPQISIKNQLHSQTTAWTIEEQCGVFQPNQMIGLINLQELQQWQFRHSFFDRLLQQKQEEDELRGLLV